MADFLPGGEKSGLAVTIALLLTFAAAVSAQEKVTFQDHILPIVEAHCSKCHNPDKAKADLDLMTYRAVLKGSGSGMVVQSGSADDSKLLKVLTHAEEPFMPPNRPKLPDQDLDVVKRWIAGGLLEAAGSKAVAAAKPKIDLALEVDASGKPEGPPAMPEEFPLDSAVHTERGNAILGLAGSPWAPVVAVAGQKQVLLFNPDTLETLGILAFPEGQPAVVAFSRSGKLLLAGGGHPARSGRVVLWDVVTGEQLAVLGDELDTVLAADIRPDHAQVAMGGPGRLVKVFATGTGELKHKIKKHTDWVTAVAYSPNGQMLASGDRNGGVSVWDPESGIELFTLAGHKAAVTALSWRGDSKILASASEEGTVKWWELEEGKQAKSWTAHNGGALDVEFTHDGRLVTCGRDRTVSLWKADGGKERNLEFSGELPVRAVFTHDAARVVVVDFAGRTAVWTAADGKRAGELEANPVPLADQLARAEQQAAAVRAQVDAAGQKVAALTAELTKVEAAAQAARQTLESASAALTTREKELAELEAMATNAPPAELEARLAAAREARQQARELAANAKPQSDAAVEAVAAVQARLAQAKADVPTAALAAAQAEVRRIKEVRARTSIFHQRHALAAHEREHAQLAARLAAHRERLAKAEQALAAARAAAGEAEQSIKSASAEVEQTEPLAAQAAAELKAEQARLDELRRIYEELKAAAVKP